MMKQVFCALLISTQLGGTGYYFVTDLGFLTNRLSTLHPALNHSVTCTLSLSCVFSFFLWIFLVAHDATIQFDWREAPFTCIALVTPMLIGFFIVLFAMNRAFYFGPTEFAQYMVQWLFPSESLFSQRIKVYGFTGAIYLMAFTSPYWLDRLPDSREKEAPTRRTAG